MCQPEAQNWVSCLMGGLQTCADSWPSVNNAAVSRTWPDSPHTLPLGSEWINTITRRCLRSPAKYSSGPWRKPSIIFRFHLNVCLPLHKAGNFYWLTLIFLCLLKIYILIFVVNASQMTSRLWQQDKNTYLSVLVYWVSKYIMYCIWICCVNSWAAACCQAVIAVV